MAVHVEPQAAARAARRGDARRHASSVEPLVAGHVDFPLQMMVSPGGRFLTLKLLRALLSGKPPDDGPGPRLPDPPPERRRDPRRHRPAPLGRHRRRRTSAASPTASASPALEAGEDVPAQLRERGLDPGEIPVVVMTHLHLDHTSAISEFPHSTFVVSAAEWQAPRAARKPSLNGYRRASTSTTPSTTARSTSTATAIGSYASFGRTFDLFGDGSVRLAFTPGHSAGPHVGGLPPRRARLRDRRRRDVHRRPARRPAPLPPRPFDAHNLRRSLQELRLFHAQYPDAIDHARARSGVLLPARAALRVASSPYIRLTAAKISVAASSWRSRLASFSTGKASGSPYSTVTLGKRSRFQPRTPAEPWIATGTIGAPLSSAIRPIPGFGSPSSPRARAPALGVDQQQLALVDQREGGLHRLLVAVAAADREDAAVLKMEVRTGGPKSWDLAMKRILRRSRRRRRSGRPG